MTKMKVRQQKEVHLLKISNGIRFSNLSEPICLLDITIIKLVKPLNELYVFLLQASDKMVAEEIGVTISTFKRMKSATGYTNTQLVEGREQFKQT